MGRVTDFPEIAPRLLDRHLYPISRGAQLECGAWDGGPKSTLKDSVGRRTARDFSQFAGHMHHSPT